MKNIKLFENYIIEKNKSDVESVMDKTLDLEYLKTLILSIKKKFN